VNKESCFEQIPLMAKEKEQRPMPSNPLPNS
jgi:hypothetical protein